MSTNYVTVSPNGSSPLMHTILFTLSIIILRASSLSATLSPTTSNTTDGLALLAFKAQISEDPSRSLSSWNEATVGQFCDWEGVTCTIIDGDGQSRVTALDLGSLGLAGLIVPSLANLTFLQRLHLSDNRLSGYIPQELGSLLHLQQLNLSLNYLQGGVPDRLGNLSASLSTLDLSFNILSGALPPSLWNLSSLAFFSVQANNKLNGEIPWDIGYSLPRLHYLSMAENDFNGPVPRSLGALQNLSSLRLGDNRLKADDDWEFLTALTNCSNLQLLYLQRNRLGGKLPSTIGNLSAHVEWIKLNENQISGNIPPEIGNLVGLNGLILGSNPLAGATIPSTIWKLPKLQVLSLYNNEISGTIPAALGNNNSRLEVLILHINNLTGYIPPSIGNISTLALLDLAVNSLMGAIPSSLGNIGSLTQLDLGYNQLAGVIPPPLWNLSFLSELSVGGSNRLAGVLPPDMGHTLPRLQYLNIYGSQIHGYIPASLSNATALELISLSYNTLQGTIPPSLGTLRRLTHLMLSGNQLEARKVIDWGFLDALTNSTQLEGLDLGDNKLGGVLPSSIANLSAGLYQLSLGKNYISGQIPGDIGNLVNISFLDLGENQLTGIIPASIGRLQRLQWLFLDGNKLSGEIPSTIGNLSLLNRMLLQVNDLSGNIPSSLANCPLERLNLNFNHLTGNIPTEILSISTLSIFLGLAGNSLTGPLSPEVGALKNLRIIYLSNNRLSGRVPSTLGECQILEHLYMDGNLFHGPIPLSLQKLKGLTHLDLSSNNLSGPIPRFLGISPILEYLNLSFNHLEGEVPKDGVFRNPNAFSLLGNEHLCGGHPNLKLPTCSSHTRPTRKITTATLLVISAFVSLMSVFVIFVAFFCWRWRPRCDKYQHGNIPLSPTYYPQTSYEVLYRATNGFSSDNLVGAGGFGAVYKGVMDWEGTKHVAVKVLNLQERGASKSFVAECMALKNTRHRNLVKVFTSCSSRDRQGNEFRALVFDYMPNGSLDMWLHARDNAHVRQRRLSLIQRLDIAIDVASALDYLHHHAPTPTIHCDLKPGNVLLDNDMNAHVSDFGLARLLVETSESDQDPTSRTGLRGSIGYIPPEYGLVNKASTQGDVYSYGILLLEMFTGKSPIDHSFEEGMNLFNYVEIAYRDQVLDITDPVLFLECDGEEAIDESLNNGTVTRFQECLGSVFRVGISCAKERPGERMHMGDVTKELTTTKIGFLQSSAPNLKT